MFPRTSVRPRKIIPHSPLVCQEKNEKKLHKKLLPKTTDFCAIFLLTKYVLYVILCIEVKKRITNEIENILKKLQKKVLTNTNKHDIISVSNEREV